MTLWGGMRIECASRRIRSLLWRSRQRHSSAGRDRGGASSDRVVRSVRAVRWSSSLSMFDSDDDYDGDDFEDDGEGFDAGYESDDSGQCLSCLAEVDVTDEEAVIRFSDGGVMLCWCDEACAGVSA